MIVSIPLIYMVRTRYNYLGWNSAATIPYLDTASYHQECYIMYNTVWFPYAWPRLQ